MKTAVNISVDASTYFLFYFDINTYLKFFLNKNEVSILLDTIDHKVVKLLQFFAHPFDFAWFCQYKKHPLFLSSLDLKVVLTFKFVRDDKGI